VITSSRAIGCERINMKHASGTRSLSASRLGRCMQPGLLSLSFAVPFFGLLSADWIYNVAAPYLSNVSDTALGLSRGWLAIPLALGAWLLVFWLTHRIAASPLWRSIFASIVVTIVAAMMFTVLLGGWTIWVPRETYHFWDHVSHSVNLFPYRFAIATLSALTCSLVVTWRLSARDRPGTKDG